MPREKEYVGRMNGRMICTRCNLRAARVAALGALPVLTAAGSPPVPRGVRQSRQRNWKGPT